MTTASIFPALAVLVPGLGAFLALLAPESSLKRITFYSLLVTLAGFASVAFMVPVVMEGLIPESKLLALLPGFELTLRVDLPGLYFGLMSSSLWLFAIVYCHGYMEGHGSRLNRFYFYYIISMSATMGVAFAGNLFTLYFFFEMLTLATYPLVIHSGTREAHRSGTRYIIYCLSGGALVVFAWLISQAYLPGAFFQPGGYIGPLLGDNKTLLTVLLVALVAGFGTKAAIMPLHAWLPGAMVAPTPVSALLHAVAVVKSGVFGIIRVLYFVYNPEIIRELAVENYLLVLVSTTIILASILALRQSVLKLRLAYSTIGQLGYITLGALLFSSLGLTGGMLHLLNHALLKITLFFCAGAVINETGITSINELKGVGRRMPLTMLCFTVGGLGLIGILPINGYISKLYLLQGAMESGKPLFAFVILASSLLNALYYLPIIINAFFREGEFKRPEGHESPPAMLVPTVILAVLCLALGLFANMTSIPAAERVAAYILNF